jgi:hypothetical protein
MGLTHYALFPSPHLEPTEAVFWFTMQLGIIFGFFTSHPVNMFLIRKGWKMKLKMQEQHGRQQRTA